MMETDGYLYRCISHNAYLSSNASVLNYTVDILSGKSLKTDITLKDNLYWTVLW